MNTIKFALTAFFMTFAVNATAQIVYTLEFPVSQSQSVQAPAADTASIETVATQSKKAA